MVRFNPVPYDGYALVFGGYDTLALMTLTRNGTISALGSKIGEGKESVVYELWGLARLLSSFTGLVGVHSHQHVSTVITCLRKVTVPG